MTEFTSDHRVTYRVTPTAPNHSSVLGPVTLRADSGVFSVQDYLTVEEAEQLADMLREVAASAREAVAA